MHLEITGKEQQIMIELLEFRVRELHPTIRRSRVSAVTDELKHDLDEVEQLLAKIRTAAGTAGVPSGS